LTFNNLTTIVINLSVFKEHLYIFGFLFRGLMKLKDKIALMTGSGSRIGRAALVLFARKGAKVLRIELK